jgi:hypothetical protein
VTATSRAPARRNHPTLKGMKCRIGV